MKEIFKLENLTKIYKDKKTEIVAVKDVNLSILEKDIFGIIGLSGAGKSTLIRCMNFLERPTTGNVFFKGINLLTLNAKRLREIRQQIGMIFQGFHLLEQRTVIENVIFPMRLIGIKKQEAIQRAKELLEMVGLLDKLYTYPSFLSGGQKQRVAIARALANRPSVLLCDEATSALDPNTTESILALLKDINEKLNITIVLITHEMKVVEQICNKVAVIDQSQIQDLGTIIEVLKNPKTDFAKRFLQHTSMHQEFGNKFLRLHFKQNVLDSVLSNLILETKVKINILEANIKQRDGEIIGNMLIQLPLEEVKVTKVIKALQKMQISYEEVII